MSVLFRTLSQRNDRIRTLEAALRWYSDEANYRASYSMSGWFEGTYRDYTGHDAPALQDRGQRAQEALGG